MHTPSLSDYVACLERGDMNGVADLMLASAEKLAAIGADFLICPDNTIHGAFSHVLPRTPLPWLHIADVAAEAAAAQGYRRLGVTGTKWLVDSDVYPNACRARNIDWLTTDTDETAQINRIIMEELTDGVFKPEAVAFFQKTFQRMKDAGCDAVVLACTEIPLIMDDSNSPLATLDSTRLLARAALKRAIESPVDLVTV